MDQEEQIPAPSRKANGVTPVFTPNPDRTFVRNVTFRVPNQSAAFSEVKVRCTFKTLPGDEAQALRDRATDAGDLFDDKDMLRIVLKGIDNIGDGQGGVLDPADAVEPMLAEKSFVYEAAMEYYDAVIGGNLRPKTSKGRRGIG